MDFWKRPDKKKRAAIKFLLQAQVVSSGVEYRLSNSDDIRSGDSGGGSRNDGSNMDDESHSSTGSDIDIGQCDIQARGRALLRWLKDSCKDGRLFFSQIRYQLFQRPLAYGLRRIVLDPGIRLLLQ